MTSRHKEVTNSQPGGLDKYSNSWTTVVLRTKCIRLGLNKLIHSSFYISMQSMGTGKLDVLYYFAIHGDCYIMSATHPSSQ